MNPKSKLVWNYDFAYFLLFLQEIARKRVQPGGGTTQIRSKLNIVDLAGSERIAKSKTTGMQATHRAMIMYSIKENSRFTGEQYNSPVNNTKINV